ncbi:MAG TPA: DNA primase [Candidatus Paceibacterota bacterium]|nr:DNA primase [Candidatus Paceibacterota bacterium]HPT40084.1 DNA primase [Candidatus Paceibacterota bacterium]
MGVIDDVKNRLDIVEIIGTHVKLSKAGANYKGLCPFHKEKTPSFMVSPERQIFHCFGCGEGGDIFKFVMKYENLEFPEALRLLAKQAGVELRKEDPRVKDEISKIREITEAANDFFVKYLKSSSAAINYLKERGLKDKTIDFWQLGFAPDGRDTLNQYLIKKGFKQDDILKTGLVIKSVKNAGFYFDRFRSRIIFPIFDSQDNVAGFTGRIFGEAKYENEPKYLNSPENPIFNKGKILYGFSKNKKAIREKSEAVLVEGQMDFLMSWQDGLDDVIATSGTALTEDQLRLLKRLAKTLVVAYDMDEAGRMATERAIDLAKAFDFNVYVLSLPENIKDLADYLQKYPGEVKKIIETKEESGDYYYRLAFNDLDKEDVGKKKQAVDFMLSKIHWLSNPVEKSHWLNRISADLDIKESYLEEQLEKLQLDARDYREMKQDVKEAIKILKTRKELLFERILALAVKKQEIRERLSEVKEYLEGDYLSLAEALILAKDCAILTDNGALSEKIGYFNLLAEYQFEEDADLSGEFDNAIHELRKETLKSLISQKTQLIKVAERNNDMEALNRHLGEFKELLKDFSKY